LALKNDTQTALIGETKKPVKYTLSEKSREILEQMPKEKLSAAVSGTVRLVLGMETNKKKINGTEIKKLALGAFSDGEIKHVAC
jgi:hypothetical protein